MRTIIKPPSDYREHYRSGEGRDANPAQLLLDVTFLRSVKRFKDVEKAIKAYLEFRPKAESWMYDQLAVTVEINKGSAEEVKTSLGWAGYLALKEGDPSAMSRVADLMILRKIPEALVGPAGKATKITPAVLIDRATEKAPQFHQPLLLSIALATRNEDPKRMGTAVEKLLSLGWPGYDEVFRTDAARQVNALAKLLREQGRDAEAKTLLARLQQASTRDLFVRLNWVGDAGIELAVDEPLGATAGFRTPRTVFGGAIVKSTYGSRNSECIYTCPRGFDGDYTVRIDVIYNDVKKPVTEAILEIITHEGTPEEKKETKVIPLSKPTPVVVTLKGGRRKEVLPFQMAPLPPAAPGEVVPPESAKPKGTDAKPKADTKPKADAARPKAPSAGFR